MRGGTTKSILTGVPISVSYPCQWRAGVKWSSHLFLYLAIQSRFAGIWQKCNSRGLHIIPKLFSPRRALGKSSSHLHHRASTSHDCLQSFTRIWRTCYDLNRGNAGPTAAANVEVVTIWVSNHFNDLPHDKLWLLVVTKTLQILQPAILDWGVQPTHHSRKFAPCLQGQRRSASKIFQAMVSCLSSR